MLTWSFRLLCARNLPRAGRCKPWLLGRPVIVLAAVIVAGCGGSGGGSSSGVRIVRGDGYRFAAPSAWPVERTRRTTAAARGEVDRIQVTTFRLLKRYRPALFAAATVELDRAADTLATQLKGRVVRTSTVRAAGRQARQYRIAYGDRAQELTFVLDGRREYQLLCRRQADAQDGVCRRLVTSFALA